jgi:hypothetical protein
MVEPAAKVGVVLEPPLEVVELFVLLSPPHAATTIADNPTRAANFSVRLRNIHCLLRG